jgi:phosphoribosylaminoimidazolecarboxamide formyltransferase / IMP cyclohydrolase
MGSAPRPLRQALISVSDKAGLVPFARALVQRGITLVSTGGTAKALADAGLKVTEVAAVTHFPEMLDGRVKTLHPAIHGGLLARRDREDHRAALAEHKIEAIDLLVCNLYPFAETVASGASREDCVENIDIGGVALIRAAAKNHEFVAVVTDPMEYEAVLAEIEEREGVIGEAMRRGLAAKAFTLTAAYDAAIAGWMAREEGVAFPERLTLAGRLVEVTRYGENPHQAGAFYRSDERRPGVATARLLQGKEMSYNNYADADAAFELAAEFREPTVVIVKHANPCGVATAVDLRTAWDRAFACDTISPFGGIVAVNRTLDLATAEAIAEILTEVVIAPGVDAHAAALFARKRLLRLLITDAMPDPAAAAMTFRSLSGGFLVQSRDQVVATPNDLKIVTKKAPSAAEIADLIFADTVAKHVKSNAIVFAKDGATVGIGAGQPSRVDSSKIAVAKAGDMQKAAGLAQSPVKGAVMASDAFFPFADGLEVGIDAGITAVIQPGGSRRDDEIIAAADKAGIAMVFTGLRHFRH